jgi:hypothetical protein
MSTIEQHLDAALGLNNPFPGLRPFDVPESELLFGREDEIQELLSRLRRRQFQAVVGSSGCGKSSLVRAGLVASLQDGFMAETTAPWRIAIMRPGNDPIAQLARALNAKQALGRAGRNDDESAAMRQAALRRGALALVEAYEEAALPPGSKLLVLVDQFEELFRFVRETTTSRKNTTGQQTGAALRRVSPADEAQAFVKLLLAAADSSVPVYVVLTMRSEFLGHCANFSGLPEAINLGLYLLPQMNREQLRDAIEGPVQFSDGKIAPRLVNRLLNDLGEADQLPILQHAMMRMWTEWSQNRDRGPIDLEHYKRIGELRASLSAHAEETYATLMESQKDVAELLFRTITETTEDQQTVRRPAEFSVICEIVRNACEQNAAPGKELTLTAEQEVTSVIDRFREEGRSFLMPSAGTPLEPHTNIDISHESLIRQWDRLREWAEKEARFTKLRRRLKGAADEWQEKNRSDATLLYTGARLLEAEEYARDRGTTLTRLEQEFLAASDAQMESDRKRKLEEARREARNRFQKTIMVVCIGATLISSGFAFLALKRSREAQQAGEAALAAQQKELKAEKTLSEQRKTQVLESYGWRKEQLSNIEDNQGILQESAKANGILQQVLGTPNESNEKRKQEITVTYFRKTSDKGVVAGVLSGLGYQVRPLYAQNENPTNVIWVNPEVIERGGVKLDDVKLVAYALIRAGIQIKRIGPPNSIEWRNNPARMIWIGTNPALESKPALTVEQVQKATAFRD